MRRYADRVNMCGFSRPYLSISITCNDNNPLALAELNVSRSSVNGPQT